MVSPGLPSWAMELVLSALQSQQEGLHTPMLHMVPVAGTMMHFEAKEDTLGNLGTGWFEETRGP